MMNSAPMIVIGPMSLEEVQARIEAIKDAGADIGMHLLEIKEREGWKTLGYSSWTAFLEGEFSFTRKHLYTLMDAAPTLKQLSPIGNNHLSINAAAAMAEFDEDLRPAILKTTLSRYGKTTESNVRRVGTVIQMMAHTGTVDIGNGTNTPIDAALDKEDEEAAKRAKTYLHERVGRHKPKENQGSNEYVPQGFDACQTPAYALDPLLPYALRFGQIWEPAAGEGLLVDALYDAGFSQSAVISSDLLTGQNFFDYEPPDWDCLITNPPYSLKYRWLERCYEMGKPFALLLPVETLGAKSAQVLFRPYGIEVLFLDRRVNFKMPRIGFDGSAAQFPVAWFTWRMGLEKQMIFGELSPDD